MSADLKWHSCSASWRLCFGYREHTGMSRETVTPVWNFPRIRRERHSVNSEEFTVGFSPHPTVSHILFQCGSGVGGSGCHGGRSIRWRHGDLGVDWMQFVRILTQNLSANMPFFGLALCLSLLVTINLPFFLPSVWFAGCLSLAPSLILKAHKFPFPLIHWKSDLRCIFKEFLTPLAKLHQNKEKKNRQERRRETGKTKRN